MIIFLLDVAFDVGVWVLKKTVTLTWNLSCAAWTHFTTPDPLLIEDNPAKDKQVDDIVALDLP